MLDHFICRDKNRGTLREPIPAPLFRKTFSVGREVRAARLTFCGLGFYRLYLNGADITRGILAPYISNTDDCVYVDVYDVAAHLRQGENTLAAVLGNGMQNALGAFTWDFDTARFQSEPKMAFDLRLTYPDGTEEAIVSDETVLTCPSGLWFNDLWCGEYFDARREPEGWNGIDAPANLAEWRPAQRTSTPRGEQRVSQARPVEIIEEREPVSITACKDGYLYDFGRNDAGVCLLKIANAAAGQEIRLTLGEYWDGTRVNNKGVTFDPVELAQVDRYICKGDAEEVWRPWFSYYGFQYVFVEGIRPDQATSSLLTYQVEHAAVAERGRFACSDEILNQLQEMTRRSALANLFFFPTDCPQREKHGWTDANQQAELYLLNFSAEKNYREWMNNIRKSQDETGMLPSIVPTSDCWGMGLGGLYWDAVVVNVPWAIWKYRGELDCFRENATTAFRYLHFLSRKRDERGLLNFGIGDWCPVGKVEPRDFRAPVTLVDTTIAYDICRKAGELFDAAGMGIERDYARGLGAELRKAAREHLLDRETMTVEGNCQTSQASFLHYGLFEPEEIPQAVERLREIIRADKGFMDMGIAGGVLLFHTLSRYGYGDLAYEMITRPEFPSYRYWVDLGATTLWENFIQDGEATWSRNHVMWGHICDWMYLWVAGLQVNPTGKDVRQVQFWPGFLEKLDHAGAWHETPYGKVSIDWQKDGKGRNIRISLPEKTEAWLRLGSAGQERVELDSGEMLPGAEKVLGLTVEGVPYRVSVGVPEAKKG